MALELKLKSTSQYDDRFKYTKIASQEEIERNESFGLTHIAIDGVSHFVNVNDESAMQELKIRLNLPYCEWFHETTGNKNWVLYDPKHYVVDKNWEGNNILKLHTWTYDGSPIGLPVNASSLCGLFSWMQVPNNIQFGRNFTLRGIVDTSLMFTGCILPSDFRFDERFNTKDVKNMRYMFYKCKLPAGFDLGEYFIQMLVKRWNICLVVLYYQVILIWDLILRCKKLKHYIVCFMKHLFMVMLT